MNELQITTLALLPIALVIFVSMWILQQPGIGAMFVALWVSGAIYAFMPRRKEV